MKKKFACALGLCTVLALVGCGQNNTQPNPIAEPASVGATPTEVVVEETTDTEVEPVDTEVRTEVEESVTEEEITETEEKEEKEIEPFTEQELNDIEAVDNVVASMVDDVSFYALDMSERKKIADEKFNELLKQGLITRLSYDEEENLYAFEYKCGIQGGMYITSDNERYYVGGEPIN